jgi:hypothetical protein
MIRFECGSRQAYQAGCRCDLCKEAESSYKRELRRRKREAVGGFAAAPVTALSLVSGDGTRAATSGNASVGSVEAAVQAEIDALGSDRGGLKATVVALARILDNPKAVSTQPAAAAKLADMLETLRKSSDVKKSKLASIRSMTSVKTG